MDMSCHVSHIKSPCGRIVQERCTFLKKIWREVKFISAFHGFIAQCVFDIKVTSLPNLNHWVLGCFISLELLLEFVEL